jgi:hypothetical protein
MPARSGPRRPSEPELWGAAECCECLGVLGQNLRTLAGLPEPYDKIRASTLWRADEIREFAQERNLRRQPA